MIQASIHSNYPQNILTKHSITYWKLHISNFLSFQARLEVLLQPLCFCFRFDPQQSNLLSAECILYHKTRFNMKQNWSIWNIYISINLRISRFFNESRFPISVGICPLIILPAVKNQKALLWVFHYELMFSKSNLYSQNERKSGFPNSPISVGIGPDNLLLSILIWNWRIHEVHVNPCKI